MKIRLSPLAAGRLHTLLYKEAEKDALVVRVVPLTSGCNTPSYALEITENKPTYEKTIVEGIPLVALPAERAWVDGVTIDWDRTRGTFSLYHPHPPSSTCSHPSEPL